MNNSRKSKVGLVDTFMEEEVQDFPEKSESITKKRSSEILADEKKLLGVKLKRKSVILENEIFLQSLKPPSRIPAYDTAQLHLGVV